MTPRWLDVATVRAIHATSIVSFGGAPEMRDPGLLESALDRPRNLLAYGDDPTIFDLAAAYFAGIVGNHPFVDGNKRVGLLAAVAFLDLNGQTFRPDEAETFTVTMALASGDVGENTLAAWFEEFSVPRDN